MSNYFGWFRFVLLRSSSLIIFCRKIQTIIWREKTKGLEYFDRILFTCYKFGSFEWFVFFESNLIFIGNPHNQLAVLATYQNDEYEAIYRYFRSLSVSKPFISARENLILLFEKNRKSLLNLRIEKEHRLNNFLLEFVRAHGILFTRTRYTFSHKILIH